MICQNEAYSMREVLKIAGFKRGEVSIISKPSSAKIIVNIKSSRVRDAAETIAKIWYARKHMWLYLFVYGPDEKCIFQDLSEGFIPQTVANRIACLPNPQDQRADQ